MLVDVQNGEKTELKSFARSFQKCVELEERVGEDYSSIGDYILIPADKAGSR